ncbi:MAG TPA: sugar ABC transporter substrate-binding protein [Sphingomonas sp.]
MRPPKLLGLCVVAAIFAAPAVAQPRKAPEKPLHIAFLAAGSQNGFNQSVWAGIQSAARKAGNVNVRLFDGGFDSTQQYNQLEDVVASHAYDGVILFPNDSVSIASAVSHAAARGINTVAVEFPIGPKLDQLEPQVPGIVATVAAKPSAGARLQAEAVGRYCRSRPVCNVVILIGLKVYPFDQLRYQTYMETLKHYPNVRVRATIEGNYDAATSMNGMLDVLQIDRHVDAVLSPADIQTIGAEMALKNFGIDPRSLYLAGGGGSQIAVTALRQGRWSSTYGAMTATMGVAALDAIVGSLRGRKGPTVIDADTLSPFPPIWTQDIMRAHPDFVAQWAG